MLLSQPGEWDGYGGLYHHRLHLPPGHPQQSPDTGVGIFQELDQVFADIITTPEFVYILDVSFIIRQEK